MEFPGLHVHTRHVVMHALQRQVTPSAFSAGDIQPRHKTVCAVDHQVQTGLCADQKGHQTD
ncbi:hypothetical protein D3C80_1835430 [compost metagenome]